MDNTKELDTAAMKDIATYNGWLGDPDGERVSLSLAIDTRKRLGAMSIGDENYDISSLKKFRKTSGLTGTAATKGARLAFSIVSRPVQNDRTDRFFITIKLGEASVTYVDDGPILHDFFPALRLPEISSVKADILQIRKLETLLVDREGEHAYFLEVNESTCAGKMRIPGDDIYTITDVARIHPQKLTATVQLVHIRFKCDIELVETDGTYQFVLTLAGNPRRYEPKSGATISGFLESLVLKTLWQPEGGCAAFASVLSGTGADADARDYLTLRLDNMPGICVPASEYYVCANRHPRLRIRATIKTSWVYEGRNYVSYEDVVVLEKAETGIGCLIPGPTNQRFERTIHSAVFLGVDSRS